MLENDKKLITQKYASILMDFLIQQSFKTANIPCKTYSAQFP